MKTMMFPGQGAQARGMGADLFDAFPELTAQADAILGYSIKALCTEDAERTLKETQFTQPALFVVGALDYLKRTAQGPKPDYVLGHSLGEFNALFAAGAFDFETGVRLVQKRGQLMSQTTNGKMAAVINASQETIEQILRDNGLDQIDLANFNSPSQIVISGATEQIERAQPLFQQGDMKYVLLNTSAAFHSRLMQPIRDAFAEFLQQFTFQPLHIPVIANVSALPYRDEDLIDNLSQQLTGSVRWYESMRYLMQQGEPEFEEVGHGNVLTKILAKIRAAEPPPAATAPPVQATATRIETPPPEPIAVQTTSEATPPQSAQEKVNNWNRRHGLGTRVISDIIKDQPLETRTEAVVLFGHRAAVYLKGYNGYFDLDEIQACP
ncbi:ACP S-malonyltransferase [Acanthopleuribacter pedis]|uniref:[acyl-carrier-protein] S-malonyltransferase n=1 Tax=Acanthopleuribacter pedis TaxID=442870 RepID=A0A8J7Q1Z1_9BACT|nr:ACP S-malonyltransferase [Acanthopleuribacter pedis]MBO1317790.1 ACP S-malonyltransferase [Acanthopleuribacter pedis]